ncbi:MAG: glycosyltransferase [Cyclobacteriaceae bacterium]
MKILQFGKFYPPNIGGMEKVIFNITEGLNEENIKCDVLCSNDRLKSVVDIINNYKIYRTASFGQLFSVSVSPIIIFWLFKLSRKKYYDIIHFHHPDPMAVLALIIVRPKQKIVLHWHLDITKQKITYLLFRPLEKWLLRRADSIIATSPNYLESSLPLKPFKEKCIVIPLGIDPPKEVSSTEVNNVIKRYNKKIIFALGRFTEYKGFEYLIESAKDLPEDYVICIGGDGPLRNKYTTLINRNQLSKKVLMLGRLSDEQINQYYKACNVFCLPSISRNEAFGLVILEAMSFHKPVVTTKIPGSGTSWINLDNVTGLNVAPMDSKKLAEALIQICSDRNKALDFGHAGFLRYKKLFTTDMMLKDIISTYNSALLFK